MATCIPCAQTVVLSRGKKDGYGIQERPACGLVQLVPTPTPETLRALDQGDSYFGGEAATGYSEYEDQEQACLATFREDVRRTVEFVPQRPDPRGRLWVRLLPECALDAGLTPTASTSPGGGQMGRRRGHPACVLRAARGSARDPGPEVRCDLRVAPDRAPDRAVGVPPPGRARLLSPGGLVLMVTPNIKSLLSRVSDQRWVSFKSRTRQLLRPGDHHQHCSPPPVYTVRAVDSCLPVLRPALRQHLVRNSSTRSPDSYHQWNASASSATARSASPAAPCASWRPTTATDPRPASRARLHWLRIRHLRARSSIVSRTWRRWTRTCVRSGWNVATSSRSSAYSSPVTSAVSWRYPRNSGRSIASASAAASLAGSTGR